MGAGNEISPRYGSIPRETSSLCAPRYLPRLDRRRKIYSSPEIIRFPGAVENERAASAPQLAGSLRARSNGRYLFSKIIRKSPPPARADPRRFPTRLVAYRRWILLRTAAESQKRKRSESGSGLIAGNRMLRDRKTLNARRWANERGASHRGRVTGQCYEEDEIVSR